MSIAIDPEVRAVILKVRDEILTDESKWAKGEAVGEAGAICIGMAIDQATQLTDIRIRVASALGLSHPLGCIAWNDAPERTFAEVRARLDHAIGAES